MRRTILKVVVLGLIGTSSIGVVSASARDAQPAYLVASLEVDDLKAYFEHYGGPVFPQLLVAGAEGLVGTPSVAVLEGDYGATWTAIVRFPSMEALDGWYASAEYRALAPERRARTMGDASFRFAAPQFTGPPAA